MNKDKTKRNCKEKAELQLVELRARLRMRKLKPPQPQSKIIEKNEVPFSWSWKLCNFNINENIFVKWRGAPSGIHELAKVPDGGLKIFGVKTPPEKITNIQGETIINLWKTYGQIRTIAPVNKCSYDQCYNYNYMHTGGHSVQLERGLICDPARCFPELPDSNFGVCFNKPEETYHDAAFVVIPASKLLEMSDILATERPVVVVAQGDYATPGVVKTIIKALEDGSDISMIQGESWIFKWPGNWIKEKYRLILRGFECRAQTMIAVTPTHFVTQNKSNDKKEVGGPVIELTTAINGSERVRVFPEKSFELVALAEFITRARKRRTIEEKIRLIKADAKYNNNPTSTLITENLFECLQMVKEGTENMATTALKFITKNIPFHAKMERTEDNYWKCTTCKNDITKVDREDYIPHCLRSICTTIVEALQSNIETIVKRAVGAATALILQKPNKVDFELIQNAVLKALQKTQLYKEDKKAVLYFLRTLLSSANDCNSNRKDVGRALLSSIENDKFATIQKDKNDSSIDQIFKVFVEGALQAKDDPAWFKLAKLLQIPTPTRIDVCTNHAALEVESEIQLNGTTKEIASADPTAVLTWNVNSLSKRYEENANSTEIDLEADLTLQDKFKLNFKQVIEAAGCPDAVFVLESKLTLEKLMKLKGFDKWRIEKGYQYVFAVWSVATKNKAGYAGVILFSKTKPKKVTFDIEHDKSFDGRVITAHYDTTVLVGAYSQCGGYDDEKKKLKHKFDKAMNNHCISLKQECKDKSIIICADLNVNPRPNDCHPNALKHMRATKEKYKAKYDPGCTPQEIEDYKNICSAFDGVNVWEKLYPFKTQDTWHNLTYDKYGDKNEGQRIDHYVCSASLFEKDNETQIGDMKVYQGYGSSDHWPILLQFKKGGINVHKRDLELKKLERENKYEGLREDLIPICGLNAMKKKHAFTLIGMPVFKLGIAVTEDEIIQQDCFLDTGSSYSIYNPASGETIDTDKIFNAFKNNQAQDTEGCALGGVGGGVIIATKARKFRFKIGKALCESDILILDKNEPTLPTLLLGMKTMMKDFKGEFIYPAAEGSAADIRCRFGVDIDHEFSGYGLHRSRATAMPIHMLLDEIEDTKLKESFVAIAQRLVGDNSEIEALLEDEDKENDNQGAYMDAIVARKCPIAVINFETKEGLEVEVATLIDEYDDYNYISKSFLSELEIKEILKAPTPQGMFSETQHTEYVELKFTKEDGRKAIIPCHIKDIDAEIVLSTRAFDEMNGRIDWDKNIWNVTNDIKVAFDPNDTIQYVPESVPLRLAHDVKLPPRSQNKVSTMTKAATTSGYIIAPTNIENGEVTVAWGACNEPTWCQLINASKKYKHLKKGSIIAKLFRTGSKLNEAIRLQTLEIDDQTEKWTSEADAMEEALTRLQPKPKKPGKGGHVRDKSTESNKPLNPEVQTTNVVMEDIEETNHSSDQEHPEAEELLSPTKRVCNPNIVLPPDSHKDPAGKKDRQLEISRNQQQQGNHPLFLCYEQSENGINSTNEPGRPEIKPLGESTVDGLGTTRGGFGEGLGREAQRNEESPPNAQPSDRTDDVKRGEAPDLNHKGDANEISYPKETKKEECRCNDRSKTQTKTREENEKIRKNMIAKLKINLQQTIKDRKAEDVEKLTDFIVDHEKTVLPDGILDLSAQPVHGFNFEIILTEPHPSWKPRSDKFTPMQKTELFKQVEEKKRQGIIEKSSAPWSSNCILINKDGKTRIAVDYRKLNSFTVKDSYKLPMVQEILDVLANKKWFTSVDCCQAYHQIPIPSERDRDLTTFSVPGGGLYRYKYMPFGVKNGGAVWSRFIDHALEGLRWNICAVYADDILIMTESEDVEDHIRDLHKVFERLDKYGIKVKGSKIKLGVKELPFLGTLVGVDGCRPDPEKTKAIADMPLPANVHHLRRFLGMASYYRRYIPGFADIAQPLYELAKKNAKLKRNSDNKIRLDPKMSEAFDKLKTALITEPVMLNYPHWDKPFEIHVDASNYGLGAVLIQKIENQEKVVMYASRLQTKDEYIYGIYQKEALAMVWAIELFNHYLHYHPFTVVTDCRGLIYIKNNTHNAKIARWVLRLQEFEFDVKHRPGKLAVVADHLSREPLQDTAPYKEDAIESLYRRPFGSLFEVESDEQTIIRPIMQTRSKAKKGDTSLKELNDEKQDKPMAKQTVAFDETPTLIVDKDEIDKVKDAKRTKNKEPTLKEGLDFKHNASEEDNKTKKDTYMFSTLPDVRSWTADEWIEQQNTEESRAELEAMQGSSSMTILRNKIGLIVKTKKVLRKTGQRDRFEEKEFEQVYVPPTLRKFVLEQHHDLPLHSHQGATKLTRMINKRYFWPKLKKDALKYTNACWGCTKRKTTRNMSYDMEDPILAKKPWETVAIDFVGKCRTSDKGNCWILTIIDCFTRYPILVPLPDRKSETVAKALYYHLICQHGCPKRILSDRAKEFISESIQEVYDRFGIKMVTTSGYNPSANGICERFHRWLNASMSIIWKKKTLDWDDYLPPIAFAYRASWNESTGYSPYFLVHGSEPTLPLDALLDIKTQKNDESRHEIVQATAGRLKEAFQAARDQQYRAYLKNYEARKHKTKPSYKENDWVILYKKTAKEARLDVAGDKRSLPRKWGNPWIGPGKFLREISDTEAEISISGERIVVSYNRLGKYNAWDNEITATGQPLSELYDQHEGKTIEEIEEDEPIVGDMIIIMFGKEGWPDKIINADFGVGQILKIRDDKKATYEVHWWGNYSYRENEIFFPGFIDTSDKKQRIKFYNGGKDKRLFTSETTDVDLSRDMIVHHGDDVLDSNKKLTKKSKERLSIFRKYFYEEQV